MKKTLVCTERIRIEGVACGKRIKGVGIPFVIDVSVFPLGKDRVFQIDNMRNVSQVWIRRRIKKSKVKLIVEHTSRRKPRRR